MTLIEIFNKYAWVGVVKKLLAGGIFTTDSSGKDAGNVIAELTNLANTLGLYTPARDIFVDWFFGNEDTAETLTAGSANAGSWLDMSALNADMRSIVIQNSDATSLDYDYEIYFSRNGLDADQYLIASGTAITTEFEQIVLDATNGYDLYIKLVITPDAGQGTPSAELDYQAYLVGRGG